MSEDTKAAEKEVKTQEPRKEGAELTVQDLAAIKQIIDVASQRGAFRPNEMTVVGTTYNKLDQFLNAVQAQQQPAQPQE